MDSNDDIYDVIGDLAELLDNDEIWYYDNYYLRNSMHRAYEHLVECAENN